MVRIVLETEAGNRTAAAAQMSAASTQARAVSHAARALSEEQLKAYCRLTRSGNSANLISKDRPRCPHPGYTPSERVRLQLALWWVSGHIASKLRGTTEELIEWWKSGC